MPKFTHSGACDASAGVPVGSGMMLVACDEDNVLRLYQAASNGPPIESFPLDDFLAPKQAGEEVDLEGAAWVGKRVYWITSHGRNKKGKSKPSRQRFFATRVGLRDGSIHVTGDGRVYRKLLSDLLCRDSTEFQKLGLAEAARKPPEDGGVNIEGLCATPKGGLLIGFRSPAPRGRALAIELTNADAVVDRGKRAKFRKPVLLNLDGRGIRSIEYCPRRAVYLIVAGPPGGDGRFSLYRWSGSINSRPRLIEDLDLGSGVSPEGLLVFEDSDKIQILLDEGDRKVAGVGCKEAPASRRSFSSIRRSIPL